MRTSPTRIMVVMVFALSAVALSVVVAGLGKTSPESAVSAQESESGTVAIGEALALVDRETVEADISSDVLLGRESVMEALVGIETAVEQGTAVTRNQWLFWQSIGGAPETDDDEDEQNVEEQEQELGVDSDQPAEPSPSTTTVPEAPSPPPTSPPADPAPSVPSGPAGHSGAVGCLSGCVTVGFQNLDGQSNVVLENLIITNPNGACLSMVGAQNITLRNVTVRECATQTAITGAGHNPIINIKNSQNIVIEDSSFENNAAKAFSQSRNNLIHVDSSPNVTIRNNKIIDLHSDINAGGPFGQGGSLDYGNRAFLILGNNVDNVVIEHNTMLNPGRNALQMSANRDVAGFRFAHNRIEGRGEWDSDFEDILNFYAVTGTPASPILIKGNYIRNGGPSVNGTAMALGDGGGSSTSEYITVEDNVLLNPGKVGIGVSGGTNFVVQNNIILADIDLPLWYHARIAEAVGMHVNDFGYTPTCGNHTVSGNRVYYRHQSPPSGTNNTWITGSCGNVTYTNNVWGDTSLTRAAIWPF